MLDAALSQPPHSPEEAAPPGSLAANDEAPPGGGVGHLCSQAEHEDVKETVRTWLEYRAHWPEQLPGWLNALTDEDQRKLGVFIATRQPWPGTSLLWWNCPGCHSTLAVCGDCRDEGVVETGNGPCAREEQCDCRYAEVAS